MSGSRTRLSAACRRRFSVADYERMTELGFLTENDRVELIRGEIVEKLTIGDRHIACVNRLTRWPVRAVGAISTYPP